MNIPEKYKVILLNRITIAVTSLLVGAGGGALTDFAATDEQPKPSLEERLQKLERLHGVDVYNN
jgi:hypothetical protein